MADIYDKFDHSLIRTFVYAKAVALEKNIGDVTPEIFIAGMLLSGPNRATQILSELNVDINVLVKRLKKLIDDRVRFNNNNTKGKSLGCNVGFSHDAKLILNRLISVKEKYKDTHIRVEYLLLDVCSRRNIDFQLNDIFSSIKSTDVTKCIKREIDDKPPSNHNDYNFDGGEYDDDNIANVGATKQSCKANTKNKAKENILDFCVDLTMEARSKKLDIVIGRDMEIEQLIMTLCRRKKNNPMLVGKPGVGKTAIVEGVAQRIVSKSVPSSLINHKILLLSLSSVVAGTQYRGQFEKRMSNIIKFFKNNPTCICFIDEMHTMLGAGNSIGGLDVGNILKPVLARNEIKCIGATTDDEYDKHFMKDGALDRRFQKIYVGEPSVDDTKKILFGIRDDMERHYQCSISDDAVEFSVKFADRYICDRNFPDKAIDLIDDVCAKAVLFKKQHNIVVGRYDVASVLSDRQGIPVDMMLSSDLHKIKVVEVELKKSIIGQDHAVSAISQTLKRAFAGICNAERPICTMVLAGPSGTGKTYIGEQLSRILFPNNDALIHINLNEFSESNSVAKLLGSPPGYVGFGEQNHLTDKLMKRPHCMILLDDLEKAHPDVVKVFAQIFDRGYIHDQRGREVNFRQSIIILTTNQGFNKFDGISSIGFNSGTDALHSSVHNQEYEQIKDHIVKLHVSAFGSAFVNKITDFILFNNFSDKNKVQIAEKMLDDLSKQMYDIHGIVIKYDKIILDKIIHSSDDRHRCNAHLIDHIIRHGFVSSIITDNIVSHHGKKGSLRIILNKDKELSAVFRATSKSSQ